MLYQTKHGQVLNDEELNMLTIGEIEEQGVHATDHWNWHEES